MNHRFTFQTQNLSPNDSFRITAYDRQKARYELIIKTLLVILLPACLFCSQAFAQTFPPASSCTSKDLTLTGATLPGTGLCNNCTTGDSVYRPLKLTIYNKTGSTRTAFAFWGTLVIRNSNGTISSTRAISGCGGPVASNDTTTLQFTQIGYVCGQSLTIKDLFLAWTDASPKSTCATINSATINPKCGTQDSIRINTGLDASFSVNNVTCATPGAIDMTPLGGKPPYTYLWVASGGGVIPPGQENNQDLTGLIAGTYTVTITDAANCTATRSTTLTASAAVTANAGSGFAKTCISNTNGQQIGVAPETGFTYSWSPNDGSLSSVSASNPTANPSSTTTYSVTKTNTSTGCSNTATVTVTVNNIAVVATAGNNFTKTCISNANGKEIGEASAAGFTYSWSPNDGSLSSVSTSNPTANPSSTTTYTVTKTNTSTGCSDTDDVTVTVDNATVVATAGDDFTKTCTSFSNGKQIGEPSAAGFTYSWSPNDGSLSSVSASNPTANPTSTTIYTVTKTKTSTGCSDTDDVTVTVDNAAVVAEAGAPFTITCISNVGGKQIGEPSAAGFTYSWSPNDGSLSSVSASNPTANPTSTTIYTVTTTKTSTGCSNTDNVTVTVSAVAPATPTFCVVQPSLCGPATGSITILSPLGADYEYSINNGTSWQASAVFNNLAAGSVTGIKVKKLSSGCISTAANCDASTCSQSARIATTSTQDNTQIVTNGLTDLNLTNGQTTIKAFPNPFSDNVKFVVTASQGGNGSLELFNMLGQKVKTVFQGRILSGANTFQVNLPFMKSAQLIYVLRVGDKKVTGKLLQLNK
jgi:PKD repeat protein